MTRTNIEKAVATALLALALAIPQQAGARGPIRLDLREIAAAPCERFEERRAGPLCGVAHAVHQMGLSFVFVPAGPEWGMLLIRGPGYSGREISNGVVCFDDVLELVEWGWTGVTTDTSSGFWFATPEGLVTLDWTGTGYRRELTQRPLWC